MLKNKSIGTQVAVTGNVFSLTKWGSGGVYYYLQRVCHVVHRINI